MQENDNQIFDIIDNISKDHIIMIELILQMHITPKIV